MILLLTSFQKRISGEYRAKEKQLISLQIQSIQTLLSNSNLTDKRNIAFLEKMEKALKRDKQAIDIGVFTSIKLARLMFGHFNWKARYDLIKSVFGETDRFIFKQANLPFAITSLDANLFAVEFLDIIMPYLFQNSSGLEIWFDEGPYEIDNDVNLGFGDVVIDCGANMGLFSAVASARGCQVYAFEPMEYTINNYLSKTAAWNPNITICPYALSDREQTLSFTLDEANIGGSRQVTTSSESCTQQVQGITLDQFAIQNNLGKIDFIKADIEGAERHMLAGARNVIREFSPKISICTYHLPDDPKVLREIILNIQPNYTIIEKYKKLYAYIK